MDLTDDDYWNTSETKTNAFNFDDDVLSPQEILAIGGQKAGLAQPGSSEESIFSPTSTNNVKRPLLSLNNLVSPKVLDLILLAQSGELPKEPRSEPEQTVAVSIKRLILGRSVSLHTYRSVRSKTELLEAAVAVGDGNVLITVLMFLMQTLNQTEVIKLLRSCPLAVAHYASYLNYEGRRTELAEGYNMLGLRAQEAICLLQDCLKKNHSAVNIKQRLCYLLPNYFSKPDDRLYGNVVSDYIELLNWQLEAGKNELNNASTLRCLAYCVENHWHEAAGHIMSPVTFCKRHQIPHVQYDWVLINIFIKKDEWDRLHNLISKKDWLGRVTFTCHVPTEAILVRMGPSIHNARELAVQLINTVKNPVSKIRIAQSYKLHDYVIRHMAEQRDRIALTNYILSLNPQSEDYILAVNTLKDRSIKWKNGCDEKNIHIMK